MNALCDLEAPIHEVRILARLLADRITESLASDEKPTEAEREEALFLAGRLSADASALVEKFDAAWEAVREAKAAKA